MQTQPEAPRRRAGDEDRLSDLLFALVPLLNVLRGDKRAFLQRAFINGALNLGSSVMEIDEGALPTNPRDAALALHRATLDLCMRAGVGRPELVEHFNDHGESATFLNGGANEAAERCLALLAIFHARRIVGVTE